MQTHLRVVPAHLEARRRALDDERRDRFRAELRIERREDDKDVGDRRVRNEGLGAIDDVCVAVAARRRLETAGVAPCPRLGETVRADLSRLQ